MSLIQPKKSQKRKRGRQPMVDGEIESAKTVTHTKVTVINDDGTISVNQVLESLDNPRKLPPDPKRPERDDIPIMDYDMHNLNNISPPPERTKTYRVRINL
jgi:hypothetical protein